MIVDVKAMPSRQDGKPDMLQLVAEDEKDVERLLLLERAILTGQELDWQAVFRSFIGDVEARQLPTAVAGTYS